MDYECSCGEGCEICEECGYPYCECICRADKEGEDDDQDWQNQKPCLAGLFQIYLDKVDNSFSDGTIQAI